MTTDEPGDAAIGRVMAAVERAGGLDYARARAQALAERAEGELEALPPGAGRDALRGAITYVVERRR